MSQTIIRQAADNRSREELIREIDDLKRYETNYRAVVEGSLDAMIVVDMDGAILYVNPAAERLFEMPGPEMIGSVFGFPVALAKPVEMYVLQRFKKFVAVEMGIAQIHWKDSLAYLISLRNITRVARAREELRLYRDQLEQEVRCRTQDLASTIVKLQAETNAHKLAEEALRESESRYRNLTENIYDWIWEVDENNVYTYSSPRSYDVLGYQPEELLWKPTTEFMRPDEAVRVKKLLHVAFSERKPVTSHEGTHIHKDGHTVWVEVNALPILEKDGTFKGYRGIIRDISERKRTEEKLKASEEKFRTLAETTHAGIVLFRGDKYIYVNPTIEKSLGYSKDELLAMNFWDIIHPDSREMVRGRGHARLQGLPVPSRYEVKVLTKGGEVLWAEFSAGMIDFQGQPTVIATIFDITERKRAEEALRESEEKFRVLAETAPVAICILQDGKFQYVNNSTVTILGYDRGYLLSIDFLNVVHPDFRGHAARLYDDWLGGRIRKSRFEIKVMRRDGAERWVDISVSSIDYRGRPGLILMATDVTDRKRARWDSNPRYPA